LGLEATKLQPEKSNSCMTGQCSSPLMSIHFPKVKGKDNAQPHFPNRKRDGTIKARTCADGSKQRSWMYREETSSPTAQVESILLTAVIEAKEARDVVTADIPNAFVQTSVPNTDSDEDRITMKITGPLVEMLVELDPEIYKNFVTMEGKTPVLFVHVIKALYGMLKSALLFYKKLIKDLSSIGFKINPYDPCVANRTINGKQHTVTWHVDDLKSSHVDPKVNDSFIAWLEKTYGDPNIGKVKATRGTRHEYLGMTLDYTTLGQVEVSMTEYIKSMINSFAGDTGENRTVSTPWSESLFKVNDKSKALTQELQEKFHTIVCWIYVQ
jgi:hypothetical protein